MLIFITKFAILESTQEAEARMTGDTEQEPTESDLIVREIIELQRAYFFEKRNVKTERQRKVKEIIERHVKLGGHSDDS